MIRGHEFHEIIGNVFDNDVQKLNESEQIRVNCPICQEKEGLPFPDGKYNLEINTAKRVFKCWKCDEPNFHGSLARLIKIFGSGVDYDLYKSYASIFKNYDYDIDDYEDVEISLPQEFISFSKMDSQNPEHFEAYNYLVNIRLLTRDIILKYKLGFCLTGEYANRIIIPSYNEYGEVNFFVSRSYKKSKRPYLMPKVNKGLFIFNDGFINWDSTIYLVEGVFDMLSLPINTIPLLGKNIQDALFYKLKRIKPNVVILLDPDAYKTAIDLFFKLISIYGGVEDRVKIIKIPTKDDIDEIRRNYGKERIIELLYTARPLTIDDYFMKKLYKPYDKKLQGNRRYDNYSKYMQWG